MKRANLKRRSLCLALLAALACSADPEGTPAVECDGPQGCLDGSGDSQPIDSSGGARDDSGRTQPHDGSDGCPDLELECDDLDAAGNCAEGEVDSASLDPRHDHECARCGDGQYPVDDTCRPLTTCAPGTFVSRAPTPSSDRQCAPCPEGSFSSAENADSCSMWRACVAGEYVAGPPDAVRDRQCGACDPGTLSLTENAVLCSAPSTCAAGQYIAEEATTSSDRQCATCQPGTLSTTENSSSCQLLVNLIENGDFSQGMTHWSATQTHSVNAEQVFESSVFWAGNPWDWNLSYSPLSLSGDLNYTLTFRARAAIERPLVAGWGLTEAPWSRDLIEFTLTTDWQTFSMSGTTSFGSVEEGRLIFDYGQAVGAVYIDNVIFYQSPNL
jgi:hypothetical protein